MVLALGVGEGCSAFERAHPSQPAGRAGGLQAGQAQRWMGAGCPPRNEGIIPPRELTTPPGTPWLPVLRWRVPFVTLGRVTPTPQLAHADFKLSLSILKGQLQLSGGMLELATCSRSR